MTSAKAFNSATTVTTTSKSMEEHPVLFPFSSASPSDFETGHCSNDNVKKEDLLSRTKSKEMPSQKDHKKIIQHKYAFKTRSQVDKLDDGYRWRKYGEKSVKNNKFPRNYYRCSYRGCNVKKQIQRHSEDEQIVVTTYEGMHIHPVEKSADSFEQILQNYHIYNQLCNVSPMLE